MIAFRKSLKDLTQYPSAIAGMILIFGFLAVSVYAMTSIPYNEASRSARVDELFPQGKITRVGCLEFRRRHSRKDHH